MSGAPVRSVKVVVSSVPSLHSWHGGNASEGANGAANIGERCTCEQYTV